MYFDRGSSVIIRDLIPAGRFARVLPARVIEDNENRTILYVSAGNIYTQANWVGSGDVKNSQPTIWKNEHGSVTRSYDSCTQIRLIRSWFLFDDTEHEFERWYINIEMEYVRTQVGFDTRSFMEMEG
jgi:hypothetical protein